MLDGQNWEAKSNPVSFTMLAAFPGKPTQRISLSMCVFVVVVSNSHLNLRFPPHLP